LITFLCALLSKCVEGINTTHYALKETFNKVFLGNVLYNSIIAKEGGNMVKIVRFDNVMIIFLYIFLFAVSVEGKSFFFSFSNVVIWFILSHYYSNVLFIIAATYITYSVTCIRDFDCSINMCKPPFQRRCVERKCVCRLWGNDRFYEYHIIEST
jgi:predicted membrane protein